MTDLIIIYDSYQVKIYFRKYNFTLKKIIQMKKSVKQAVMSAAAALSPFFAMAHEGHGHTDGFTIKHYLVEPEHILVGITVIFAAIATGVYLSKKAQAKKNGESA